MVILTGASILSYTGHLNETAVIAFYTTIIGYVGKGILTITTEKDNE